MYIYVTHVNPSFDSCWLRIFSWKYRISTGVGTRNSWGPNSKNGKLKTPSSGLLPRHCGFSSFVYVYMYIYMYTYVFMYIFKFKYLSRMQIEFMRLWTMHGCKSNLFIQIEFIEIKMSVGWCVCVCVVCVCALGQAKCTTGTHYWLLEVDLRSTYPRRWATSLRVGQHHLTHLRPVQQRQAWLRWRPWWDASGSRRAASKPCVPLSDYTRCMRPRWGKKNIFL